MIRHAKYSIFGEKLGLQSGIVDMMDNLTRALSTSSETIMLGGGNPARLDSVAELVEETILSDFKRKGAFFDLLCNYSSPKGDSETAAAVAKYLRSECDWDVTADNIFFSNGSQSALFMLFNMLAGRRRDGSYGKAMLPFVPEYIGYEDIFVDGNCFVSAKPSIEKIGGQFFKYKVDLSALIATDDINCVAISNPSNPTGKKWDSQELDAVRRFSQEHRYPLIYDNAYGWPFPNVQFGRGRYEWDENMIVTMSMSKMGMPGLRVGVVVANLEVIERLRCISAVSQLSPNTMGMYVLKRLIETGILTTIANSLISPFYAARSRWLQKMLCEGLNGYPVRIHESQGTMFLWLWMEGLPITSSELYDRINARKVLTLSGHHFFIGHKSSAWRHKDECLRITFTQSMEKIEKGVNVIIDEIKKAYEEGSRRVPSTGLR